MPAKEPQAKILVVDDDDMIREFLKRVLKSINYEPICASDGDSAIKILESEKSAIKLVIVDLLMPIMTGWELIQYIKKDKNLKDIPVVVTTGLDNNENLENINEFCEAVICKSEMNISKFTDIVNKIVAKNAK